MSVYYTPDRWAIISIKETSGNTLYKVLGSWYGGNAGSDVWKLNSGITNVVNKPNHFEFAGYSGSVYKCHKQTYGTSSLAWSIYLQLKEKFGDRVEMLDEAQALKISDLIL